MDSADHISGGGEVSELLNANVHFARHLYGFIMPMSLKCAVQLGIPDAINRHGKPMTLAELCKALPIHPQKTRFLPQLMRILSHAGHFSKHRLPGSEEETAYGLTPVSQFLLQDHPFTVKPQLLFAIGHKLMDSWLGLSRWFQSGTDQTPFHTAHGMSFWECMKHDHELNRNFNDAMVGDSRMVASVLVANDELSRALFGGVRSLVDVGGGIGGLVRPIVAAYPEMKCTVLDLPQVVEASEETDNLKFVAGDMFLHVPSADAVLIKWVLHDWDDEDSVRILKQCRKAVTGNGGRGKVIIIEVVINNEDDGDDKLQWTQLLFDMQMMGIVAGKERSEKEWKKIFDDAGFAGGYKIHPVLGIRSVIEVYP